MHAMNLDTKLPKVGTTIFSVMSQLAAEHGAINLGQGFPDFSVPDELAQALAEAVRAGHNQYAPSHGIAALRQAIADLVAERDSVRIDPDACITITSGGSEAILDAVLAVVRPGDEVIVLDPCYDCYEPAIELAGGVAIHVPLDPASFTVDWQRVRDAIGPRTRLLMVNTPHNPSGAVLAQADLDALADILRDTDVLLLSDEVYEHMVFDGRRHLGALSHPELAARAFVVSSFGKTYHCTGWKLGSVIAPPALSRELRKVHQYNTFSSFTPAQWAVAHMLTAHPQHHRELPAFYQHKRDAFRALLAPTALKLLPVAGGYFQLVDYSALSDLDDAAFCRWLTTEKGVAAIPLSPFYADPPVGQRLARLCFAKHAETLEAAARRLQTP